jgi:hypothetical protein
VLTTPTRQITRQVEFGVITGALSPAPARRWPLEQSRER